MLIKKNSLEKLCVCVYDDGTIVTCQFVFLLRLTGHVYYNDVHNNTIIINIRLSYLSTYFSKQQHNIILMNSKSGIVFIIITFCTRVWSKINDIWINTIWWWLIHIMHIIFNEKEMCIAILLFVGALYWTNELIIEIG